MQENYTGLKVAVIAANTPKHENYCPNFVGIKKGLERLKVPYIFLNCRPEFKDFDLIKKFQPNLVVYMLRDMIYNPEWRHRIREENPQARIILWYGDYREKQNFQNCSEMDAMFVSNDAQEEFYKDTWKMKEVNFLPLGCEPEKETTIKNRFAFNFVFIGGQYGGVLSARAVLIEKFIREGGLRLINSMDEELRTRIIQNMPAIYSSSKICLDISHYTHIYRYTSNRYWNIPAMFGFALTKRFPGCEEFYSKEERVYFDEFEEAIEKYKYYLDREEERKKFIKKAWERSWDHTYDKRFLKMFKILGI